MTPTVIPTLLIDRAGIVHAYGALPGPNYGYTFCGIKAGGMHPEGFYPTAGAPTCPMCDLACRSQA